MVRVYNVPDNLYDRGKKNVIKSLFTRLFMSCDFFYKLVQNIPGVEPTQPPDLAWRGGGGGG
jgi:hypothetical protein